MFEDYLKIDAKPEKRDDEEFCKGCQFFKLLDDPDPIDWFRDGDQIAICELLKAVIASSLTPGESGRIHKPVFCPYLKKEQDEEEKQYAENVLTFAKKRYRDEVKNKKLV